VTLPDETVEEKEAKIGKMWLYFGCRDPNHDFLYRKELEKLEGGDQIKLTTAFSRVGAEKVYVQHRMKQEAKELLHWLLEDDAVLFLCGDGANMAKDVRKMLEEILEEEGGKGKGNGKALVDEWVKQGKYLQDIWS